MYRSMFRLCLTPYGWKMEPEGVQAPLWLTRRGRWVRATAGKGGLGGGKAYPPPFERWDKLCAGKQRTPLCPGMPLLLEGSLRGLREGSF